MSDSVHCLQYANTRQCVTKYTEKTVTNAKQSTRTVVAYTCQNANNTMAYTRNKTMAVVSSTNAKVCSAASQIRAFPGRVSTFVYAVAKMTRSELIAATVRMVAGARAAKESALVAVRSSSVNKKTCMRFVRLPARSMFELDLKKDRRV